MKNYVQEGERIVVPAPAAVTSGDGVVVGTLFGVAGGSAALNEDVVLSLEGVFILPKAAGAITLGAAVYWNNSTKVVTTTASGNLLIGKAFAAAADADTTAIIRIRN